LPSTPYQESLEEGIYSISMPEIVETESGTYVFKQWEDGSKSPTRQINLVDDISIVAIYELSVGNLVGSVTNPYATQGNFQRKCFYANGLFWVFYANTDRNRFVYRTSPDGVVWSGEHDIRVGDYGPHISVFFDGEHIHYAATGYGSPIYYRRGVPNPDGTITWVAPEQVIHTLYDRASNPVVAVDSYGYVWIGYREKVNEKRLPFVIRSGNYDGTWGDTPEGFPFQLCNVEKDTWAVSPIPLTNGKVAVVFTGHEYGGPYGEPIHIRVWDGGSWLSEVLTASGCYHSMFYSAVAQGDDVHIVFQRLGVDTTDIVYVKYSYASHALSSEVVLQSGIPLTDDGTDYCAPVITRAGDELYVFWGFYPEFAHIYYRRWNGSEWEPRVDWITEADFPNDQTWSAFYCSSPEGYIGLLYLTNIASPYDIKFAYLIGQPTSITPPTPPPPPEYPKPPERIRLTGPLGFWSFPLLTMLLEWLSKLRRR